MTLPAQTSNIPPRLTPRPTLLSAKYTFSLFVRSEEPLTCHFVRDLHSDFCTSISAVHYDHTHAEMF